MELYLERALSVARLNYHQLEKLHGVERSRGLTLTLPDVTDGFRLRWAFAHWGIPNGSSLKDRTAREKHLERVMAELKAAGCTKNIYRSSTRSSVEEWHAYDDSVFRAVEYGQVDLLFRKQKSKSSLFDEIEAEG